jgi:2-polyprenyl-3-methyl-5-hydroxy-6-metoxy-1,4-benzoquinol methylase
MRQRNPHLLHEKLSANLKDIKPLLVKRDELIDVGCGEGHLYKALGHAKYTGIDRDLVSIKLARNAWPSVDFRNMDLYDLKGSWDVVVCSRVLVHLPDFEGAMKVLRRCARKYCVIIVATGPDRVEFESRNNVYFRTFSEGTLRSVGDCVIKDHQSYSTVIYAASSH